MKKITWFLGEFFVVVSGVLVAFLLNGWWISIQQDQKEQDYLHQIHKDVQSTIRHVKEAEDEQREVLHAASQLMAAAYSTIPPADTVLVNYTISCMRFSPGSQVSAALSSLVNTGEFHLIDNDSLRTALAEFTSRLSDYTTTNNHMAYDWLIPVYENFADAVNVADLRYQAIARHQWSTLADDSLMAFPHPDNLLLPSPVDFNHLLRDQSFRNVLIRLYVAQANLYRLHRDFHEDLNMLNDQLERELSS